VCTLLQPVIDLTRVFRVRKVDSTELSLCLLRCFASTPNPPCDTPCLAIVNDLCIVLSYHEHITTKYAYYIAFIIGLPSQKYHPASISFIIAWQH